jgi:TRAP-type mannitol/chloroaromatic compound transport system permease small subunit
LEGIGLEGYWKYVNAIDKFSDVTGRLFSYLVYPLVGCVAYEVFARYMFGAPTVWAYDVTYMFYGSIFMLGAAYTLLKKGHIRTDLFYNNWSPQKQGKIDAIMYLLFFCGRESIMRLIRGSPTKSHPTVPGCPSSTPSRPLSRWRPR